MSGNAEQDLTAERLEALILNNCPGVSQAAAQAAADVESGRRAGIGKLMSCQETTPNGDEVKADQEAPQLTNIERAAAIHGSKNPDGTQQPRPTTTRGNYWVKKANQTVANQGIGSAGAVGIGPVGMDTNGNSEGTAGSERDTKKNMLKPELSPNQDNNNGLAPGQKGTVASLPPTGFRSLAVFGSKPQQHGLTRMTPMALGIQQHQPLYIPAPVYTNRPHPTGQGIGPVMNPGFPLTRSTATFQLCSPDYHGVIAVKPEPEAHRAAALRAGMGELMPEWNGGGKDGSQARGSSELRMRKPKAKHGKESNEMRVDNIPLQMPKEDMMDIFKRWGACKLTNFGETDSGSWMVVRYGSKEETQAAIEKGNLTKVHGHTLCCTYYDH